jgi:hypothetical protein
MARAKGKKNYRNRVQFKWTKELIFLLVGLAVCIGLVIFCLIPTRATTFYNTWYSSDNSLQKDNVFEEISYDSLKNKVEKGELVYVFYGTEKDSTSVTNIGVLDHYTNKFKKSNDDKHYDVDKIYVYNAKEAYNLNSEDENAVEALNKKKDWFNTKLAKDESTDLNIDEISLQTYSQLWIFKDGKMVYSSQTILNNEQASDQSANFTLAAFRFLSYGLEKGNAKYSY